MSLDWAHSVLDWLNWGWWVVCLFGLTEICCFCLTQVLEITNICYHTQLKVLNLDDANKNPFCHGFSLIHYLISMLQMKKKITTTMEKPKFPESTQLANHRARIDI